MKKDIAAALSTVASFLEDDDNLERLAAHIAKQRPNDTTKELADEANAIFESVSECADDLAQEEF